MSLNEAAFTTAMLMFVLLVVLMIRLCFDNEALVNANDKLCTTTSLTVVQPFNAR